MPILQPSPDNIALVARNLLSGGVAGIPTETVYGLGAHADRGVGVTQVFALKGRPTYNPLIVHVTDLDAAAEIGHLNATARALSARYWPGPLTLVVDLKPGADIDARVTAGKKSIAIRVPAHPVARMLLSRCGFPIAAPSANVSGHVSPTMAEHVKADFPENVMILDGGTAEHGLESTIVDCRGDQALLLRPGHIHAEILAEMGVLFDDDAVDVADIVAPGQMESHYAPRAKVRLNAIDVAPHEAALSFGDDLPGWRTAIASYNLSPGADFEQAAHNLFDALRTLDASGAHAIAVSPIPTEGLGRAINNRLQRAAAPR